MSLQQMLNKDAKKSINSFFTPKNTSEKKKPSNYFTKILNQK
ncbi:hypothetical protein [Morganella morganii]|nr:hypothetical protein [Morganella morganii]